MTPAAAEVQVEVEGRTHELHAGDGLEIAPTLAHQVTSGAEPAEFLVVSQPPSHGDRELAPGATGT